MNGTSKLEEMKRRKRNQLLRDSIILVVGIIATTVILFLIPEKTTTFFKESKRIVLELVAVLPAVMILMGLFNVFVSRETVVKYLGSSAGIKSLVLGLGLGTLPTGPLYIAFPIAASLRRKGARPASVLLFLFSWSCIKLPQELAELRFMGYEFMLVRLGATIALTVPTALILERILNRKTA